MSNPPQKHRGPHPEDVRLFGLDQVESLRTAVHDLCWLFSRGYAAPSSVKIVGDRYAMQKRQREAITRASCPGLAAHTRQAKCLSLDQCANTDIEIDGFNLLTSIEAALSGGAILSCCDGTYRDMASMHGSYRKVTETDSAIMLIGTLLEKLRPASISWYLDTPVSNSGRLKTMLAEIAQANDWDWNIQLVPDPDKVLSVSANVVVTSDSMILDRCQRWTNLARWVISHSVPDAWVVELCEHDA